MLRLFPAVTVIALAIINPAAAKTLTFRATLSGIAPPSMTGSPARGTAVIKVDTASQKVSLDLDVTGIMLDQLDRGWVAKPAGPIHLHSYRSADDMDAILPVPYGGTYTATKSGFRVTLRGYDYAAGEKLLNSGASFDEFVNGLRGQRIVVDIHTGKFPDGEISGKTMPG